MTGGINVGTLAANMRKFYTGRIYPLVVAALVLIGSVLAVEIFTASLVVLLFVGAALLCDSARPLIITVTTFCFQMSVKYSPSPSVSDNHDYYFTSWRLPVFTVYIVLIVAALVVFFVKNGCYKRVSLRRDLLLLPIAALCAAFLLSGAFCGGFFEGLWFSLAQAAVFSIFYFVFAYGFRPDEGRGELTEYLAYTSAVTAVLILAQLAHLFITSDDIFVDGGINKVGVMLGWGSWALIGLSLATLIPIIFYGAMRGGRASWAYLAVATLAWGGALLSMSRGAQLFATLAYAACVIIAAVKAHRKLFYRVLLGTGAVCALVAVVIFFDKIPDLLAAFLDDNGRAEHAKIALDNFLAAPVFGVGFLNFESLGAIPPEYAPMGPWPAMAHNTLLELLSATGAVGTLAYLVYRAASLYPVFKRPTLERTMLFVSVAALLLSSLLDNFVFDVYPMLLYSVALAIIHKREPEAEDV